MIAGGVDFHAVIEKVAASVVSIQVGPSSSSDTNVFGAGTGSGVVISSDGLVLTNHRVIQSATAASVDVRLADGRTRTASVVGRSPDDDLALLRLGDVSGIVAVPLGDSSAVRVGDEVVVIGHALDLGVKPTVTRGIVSAKHRSITNNGVTLDDLVQTDAAINRGNTGGAMVDAAGQLIGLPTTLISDAQNIGFAIDVDVIKQVLPELRAANGGVLTNTVLLGVQTQLVSQLQAAEKTRFAITANDGLMVAGLIGGGGAEAAGVQVGDLLISVDGQRVVTRPALVRVLRQRRPGDTVTVAVQRGATALTLKVRLSPR